MILFYLIDTVQQGYGAVEIGSLILTNQQNLRGQITPHPITSHYVLPANNSPRNPKGRGVVDSVFRQ